MEKLMHFKRLDSTEKPIPLNNKQILENKMVLPSLDSLINDKRRSFIIKKIFKNQNSEYFAFIKNLEMYRSWNDALKRLDAEMTKRKINNNSEAAVLLSNIVYLRYFPNDDEIQID